MSGNLPRTSKSTIPRKETRANFAWRTVSSEEISSRVKWQIASEVENLDESDRGPEDWRIFLDDSDDSTSGWGQNSSSSSASWSDDLESEATSLLQQQLNVLDKIVFSEELTPEEAAVHIPSDLLEEVTLWKTSYPHLRIKGTSLPVPPFQEDGEATEEILASHGIAEDVIGQCTKVGKRVNDELNSDRDDYVTDILKKPSAELKADVMKRLFDSLWPDVLACVQSKILSRPRDLSNSGKDADQLPLRSSAQRLGSAVVNQNSHSNIHELKHFSNSLDIPEKQVGRYSNQINKEHMALDSILKVSPMRLKQSAVGNIPNNVGQRSYHILSSRGQTHLISNRNHHVTLPPIAVPSDATRGNSGIEGSLSHLRSASALSHEHHQLMTSRPNTSTLIPTCDNTLKSYISISPPNLTKQNISFNVLGRHLPANLSLPWNKSAQKRTNIYR